MGWRRADFKDKQVWAQVDDTGQLRAEGGRVAIRYSERSGAKIYKAGASRVALQSDAPVQQLEDGVSADAKTAPKRRGSGFGKAGTRTPAQAAAAAAEARRLIADLPEGTAVAYTDGACRGNPGPAGSGVLLELPDGRTAEASRSLGSATNNIAELTAIGIALELLDDAEVPGDHAVAVLTDSSYANGVLCKGWKAKANAELIRGLRTKLAARPGVTVHWVAGHAGVEGNERADALASEAAASGTSSVVWA